MLLDPVELFLGQLTRFVYDIIRNTELADIVKETCKVHHLPFVLAETDAQGKMLRNPGVVHRVGIGVGRGPVDDHREDLGKVRQILQVEPVGRDDIILHSDRIDRVRCCDIEPEGILLGKVSHRVDDERIEDQVVIEVGENSLALLEDMLAASHLHLNPVSNMEYSAQQRNLLTRQSARVSPVVPVMGGIARG